MIRARFRTALGGIRFSHPIGGCLSLAVALAVGFAAGCRSQPPQRSVLLVVVDTLRADHVGLLAASPAAGGEAHGARVRPPGSAGRTPMLDRRFAPDRAAVFRTATSPAPFTMPSVAGLLTGAWPDRTGVFEHEPGVTLASWPGSTLAESAARAGLATAAVVANPWLSRRNTGFDRGFGAFSRLYRSGTRGGAADAASVTDAAIAHLDSFGGRPFFLWVHYFDPHMPYEPPAAFAAAEDAAGRTSRVMEDFRTSKRDLGRIYRGQGFPPSELDLARRLYAAEVAYTDRQLERLLAELDARGLDGDTLVVVVADHGEALGEHGLHFAHDFTLYEELLRVPLLMRGPGVEPGLREDEVSLLDVAPTLCRLATLPCAAQDGRDLFEGDRGPRALFAAATTGGPGKTRTFARLTVPGVDGRWTSVRRGGLKLLRIPTPDGPVFEMYDLAADPSETRGAGLDHPLRAELREELEAWMRRMDESRPTPAGVVDAGEAEKAKETLRSLGYLQ